MLSKQEARRQSRRNRTYMKTMARRETRMYKQFTSTHEDVKFMFTVRGECHEGTKGLCNKKRHKQVFHVIEQGLHLKLKHEKK